MTVDDNHPSVTRTVDLVEYQEGSVVSRTLMKRATGTVTVFAFDAGQALSEHTVPHDAWVQVIDGRAEIRIDGASYRLESGDSLMMPAHHPHAVAAVERFKMVLTMIRS
jgi:quercetin dioxygenase-like cupin family protein